MQTKKLANQCCMCCITIINHTYKQADHRSHNTNFTPIRTHVSGVRHCTILSLSLLLRIWYDWEDGNVCMYVCVAIRNPRARLFVCLVRLVFVCSTSRDFANVLCAVVYCLYHYGPSNVYVKISQIPSAFWVDPLPPLLAKCCSIDCEAVVIEYRANGWFD